MNYIQETNAFYEWLDSNPMPASAISLWHTLMQINNRGRWSGEFTVAISTLVSKTGSQRSAVFASRKLLIAKGRIKCTTNGSSYAATYSLIPFSAEAERQGGASDKSGDRPANREPGSRRIESDKVPPKSADEQTSHRTDAVPINKQKETKLNSNQEPEGSSSSADDPAKCLASILDDFNQFCKNLPQAKVLTERRKQMVLARLHEHGYEKILVMLRNAGTSNFLAGDNQRQWVATFDWLFRPTNFAKVLEGNYANNRSAKANKSAFVGKPSPLELIEEAYNGIMNQQNDY